MIHIRKVMKNFIILIKKYLVKIFDFFLLQFIYSQVIHSKLNKNKK